jgi:hypothetical protein
MDVATHRRNSKITHTVAQWIKAIATALIAVSTATWAQVDITSEVSVACTDNAPRPEIRLVPFGAPAVKGINRFLFAGSGPTTGGAVPPRTVPIQVTRELVGGNLTIIRAKLLYSVFGSSNSGNCLVADVPLSNPGTNEVRYVVELYDVDDTSIPRRLVSTAEARATFNVPIVTVEVPTLSTWSLIALLLFAAAIGTSHLKRRVSDAHLSFGHLHRGKGNSAQRSNWRKGWICKNIIGTPHSSVPVNGPKR